MGVHVCMITCIHMGVHVCMFVYMFMWVCRVHRYTCVHVHVCAHELCICACSCACTCLCVHVDGYTCMHVYVHGCTCVFIWVYMCGCSYLCVRVYMCACSCVCMSIHECVFMYVCMGVHVHVHGYICVHVCVCVCMGIHVHMNVNVGCFPYFWDRVTSKGRMLLSWFSLEQDICVLITKLDLILESAFGLTSRRCFLFLIQDRFPAILPLVCLNWKHFRNSQLCQNSRSILGAYKLLLW